MEEITGYFRVNETPEGAHELAVYKRGFAPAEFKDRIIIDTYSTREEALEAITSVMVTVSRNS
jgi:hypothetical protein